MGSELMPVSWCCLNDNVALSYGLHLLPKFGLFFALSISFDNARDARREGNNVILGCVNSSPMLAFFWLCHTTAFFLILRVMHGVVCGALR